MKVLNSLGYAFLATVASLIGIMITIHVGDARLSSDYVYGFLLGTFTNVFGVMFFFR